MRSKFENYFSRHLFDDRHSRKIFYEWDFDRIWRESDTWKLKARPMYVYILANECERPKAKHAYVGATENIRIRMEKHNNKRPGGPPATKKDAGNWKIVMYMIIPPIRNYSTKEVKDLCKNGRGWSSKCIRAIKFATQRGLVWKVTRDIANEGSVYHSPSIIKIIKKETTVEDVKHVFIEDELDAVLT